MNKMGKPSIAKKLRYKFDEMMSSGPIAMIGLLALLSVLVVVCSGLVLNFFNIYPEGENPLGFIEGVWQSLMRTLDAGTMGGDQGWSFRFLTFLVTLGGIFIVSTLIGVLSSGIEGKLDQLRKGKSLVIEKDFTLILGWSSKIYTIVSELVIANENQKNPCIVILADRDKVEMEDELRAKITNLKNMKIVCRNGNPNNLIDLAIANPNESKSIIILAAEEGNSDSITIKTILAITNNSNRRLNPYHIIAEIKIEKNLEVAKMVGKDEIELILTDDIIGRIMVQTARQSGLSIVYKELMDFEGAEIYFCEERSLIGKTYGESIFAYRDSIVIGLQFTDGVVKINPSMDYELKQGDKIIAISQDDDTLILSNENSNVLNENAIVNENSEKLVAERVLILGWNKRAMIIIRELDNYLGPNSYLKVVSSFDNNKEELLSISESLKNIVLEFDHQDTTDREVIESLDITSYDSLQILCYKEEMDMQEADAQTLITLLHIRRLMEEMGKDIKVVSEMLDIRNRELAEVTKADDFIVSDELISLLMSQIAENKNLMRVFEDLFNAEGSEIYLKPMSDYIKTGQNVDFYTILESAKRKGQTAIGYRISALAHNNLEAYGVVINPLKSNSISFSASDKLIVLSEN